MNGLNESKSYWARKLFGREAKAKNITRESPSQSSDGGTATATIGPAPAGSKATVLLFQPRESGTGGTAVLAIDGNTDDEGNIISTTADVNVELVEGQRVSVIRSGRDLTVIPDGEVVAATAEPIATAAASTAIAEAVGQYFWHDTQGVHVSNAKPIVAGTRNILVNAYGMALYNGNPAQSTGVNKGLLLASFAEDEVNLGYMPNPSEGDSATVNFFSADTYLQVLATAGGYKRMILQADDYRIGNLAISTSNMQFGGKMVLTEDNLPSYNERGASAYLTNTAAASTTTTLAKVTLGASIKQSSLATSLFAKSSNGIQCKKAGTVLVSGEVYCQNLGSSNNLAVDIYKGTTSQFEVVQSCGMTGFATAAITPRALTVAANDVISLYVKSTTAASNGIPAGGACLTVTYM